MNALVELAVVPVLNSLILIGLTFRTFSAVVSTLRGPCTGSVHEALPTRSPFSAFGPEVTLNVAVTLAPGATESNVTDSFVLPATTEVQLGSGTEMLNFTPT